MPIWRKIRGAATATIWGEAAKRWATDLRVRDQVLVSQFGSPGSMSATERTVYRLFYHTA
jgi:hypothetical protein